MRATVIQGKYDGQTEENFREMLKLCDSCEKSDIIVLPEYASMPKAGTSKEINDNFKNNEILLKKCRETAKRCGALLFVNMPEKTEKGFRNVTFAINPEGEILHKYNKMHLPYSEKELLKCDYSYRVLPDDDYIFDYRGVRYAFLTCYDVYFGEYISLLARKNVDVIIFPAYQRSEKKEILISQNKLLAYYCNAFVLRSSYSMGKDNPCGGQSMIVMPDGEISVNAEQKIGVFSAEIDAKFKYFRSNGHNMPQIAGNDFINYGRSPKKYQNAGFSVCLTDKEMPYPRICAHRGFNTVAPENTLPAFAAAVSLGADEIELDVKKTLDGELVICHDRTLRRTTDMNGVVTEMTLEEIRKADAGIKCHEKYSGTKIPLFEEVLQNFAGRVIMNIHISAGMSNPDGDDSGFKKLCDLIYRYNAQDYVYFACNNDLEVNSAKKYAPEITRCCLIGTARYRVARNAVTYDCQKIQLFKPYFTQDMIDYAKENNIICNLFWSNDVEEAKYFIGKGIDNVLTDDFLYMKNGLSLDKSGKI